MDDRGTIEEIQENPYIQYFVELQKFSNNPIFDSSLFVEIRKRLGAGTFNKLTDELIQASTDKINKKHNENPKEKTITFSLLIG